MGLTGREGEASEYAELVRKLEAAKESDVVEQALTAARDHLGMDASYLTTIDERNQTIHAIVADEGDPAKRYQGTVFPVEQTFCMRMLSGEIPNMVPDTSAEPAISHLPAAAEFHAYVGVPVKLADGRVHGTFCCVSHAPRTELVDEELRFMQVLAGIVGARIDQARGDLTRLLGQRPRRPQK
ncbi:MAG TPA: GAF domain-containing protein [Solirubrobacteraceae bacterium]|nr:GAF domain-containing protein [Solirubrobacteraceae bacterium]